MFNTTARKIKVEKIWDKMMSLFLYFENEDTAKQLLQRNYVRLLSDQPLCEKYAFTNTQKFIYFLKQGTTYFVAARSSERMIQPLLTYYGMTSLMKALILLHDPNYPKTTAVLQHGLTTRKKKKDNYDISFDEIKIQKDGLVPHFSKVVFNFSLTVHEKFNVKQLIGLLPEFQPTYELIYNTQTLFPLQILSENSHRVLFRLNVTEHLIQHLSNTTNCSIVSLITASNFIMHDYPNHLNIDIVETNETYIDFILFKHDGKLAFIEDLHPSIFRDYKGNFFLNTQKLSLRHELIVFNMLMYILGMLCRYDTEAWGDILFTRSSDNLFLIDELLRLTIRKFPNLILNHLFNECIIFEVT